MKGGRNQCPDCWQGLQPGATQCRCGWTEPEAIAEASVPTVRCDTPSCDQPAFVREGEKNTCRRCYEGHVNSKAFERCKEKGLTTVAEMKEYCKKLTRQGIFGRPSFESWAETMKQTTVDYFVRSNGPDDLTVLERLRRLCVIDAQQKIIPAEKRPALRAERDARTEKARRQVEEQLRRAAEAKASKEGAT